ncbi:MAG: hypothetical protein J6U35_03070, partial [Clostridia bacterium]|nr:hypothetical protein [Clostridia bacterium]
IGDLRKILRAINGTPGNKKKDKVIDEILKIQSGEPTETRSKRGRPASNSPEVKSEEVKGEEVKSEKQEVRVSG